MAEPDRDGNRAVMISDPTPRHQVAIRDHQVLISKQIADASKKLGQTAA
jgi:hypothetical protein